MTMTEEPTTETSAAPAGANEAKSAEKGGKGKKDKKAKEAKGGRSNLVPAVVLAMGIAAGGYFVGGSGAAADTDVSAEEEAEIAVLEAGEVVELEAMTVNLANGRFLRVGVSVLVSTEFESLDGDPRHFKPEHNSRLRDQLIAMFAGRDVASLTGAENLDAIKVEMLDRVNVVLDGHAFEVYLTEFVSQ